MYEEVHPCRVNIIYSNSRIPRIWKLGPLAWFVRLWSTPSLGFHLKVAEIHDVYMVVSGESVCEEVHPCRVNIIYSNSCVRGNGLLGCL